MNKLIIYGILTGGLIYIFRLYKRSAYNRRRKFIDSYVFPESTKAKILETYPNLTTYQINEVMKGLKEYFHICNMAGQKFVSMPSQVVDLAWHEFILFTLKYQNFCTKAFTRFLHHTPAEAMRTPTAAQEGIQRAWMLSCKRENINPKSPEKLPLLFRLDDSLNIPNGFVYKKDCKNSFGDSYCASDIGCASSSVGCGGDQGCGGSSCSSGCGGGGD